MYVNGIKFNFDTENKFPYDLKFFQYLKGNNIDTLNLSKPITFFTGENGSGKSTLLEAIAVANRLNPEGGTQNFNFSTYNSHSSLFEKIRLVKSGEIPETSFFLRSETYYNLATEIIRLNASHFYAKDSLHNVSHGQGVLSIIQFRFTPNGFYLMDEPESGLSVRAQLTLLNELHSLVEEGCQFIIATHSPVLLAAPNSEIFQFDNELKKVKYEETDAYQDMKTFLDSPDRFLHYLLKR